MVFNETCRILRLFHFFFKKSGQKSFCPIQFIEVTCVSFTKSCQRADVVQYSSFPHVTCVTKKRNKNYALHVSYAEIFIVEQNATFPGSNFANFENTKQRNTRHPLQLFGDQFDLERDPISTGFGIKHAETPRAAPVSGAPLCPSAHLIARIVRKHHERGRGGGHHRCHPGHHSARSCHV